MLLDERIDALADELPLEVGLVALNIVRPAPVVDAFGAVRRMVPPAVRKEDDEQASSVFNQPAVFKCLGAPFRSGLLNLPLFLEDFERHHEHGCGAREGGPRTAHKGFCSTGGHPANTDSKSASLYTIILLWPEMTKAS